MWNDAFSGTCALGEQVRLVWLVRLEVPHRASSVVVRLGMASVRPLGLNSENVDSRGCFTYACNECIDL